MTLPEPTRLPTPPGAVLVLRGDAAPWDGNAEGLSAALEHLHSETGCPVVFIDTTADDGLELSSSLPEEAEAAMTEAVADSRLTGSTPAQVAAQVLRRLREAGWQLVQTRR